MKSKIIYLSLIINCALWGQEQQMNCATTLLINQNVNNFKVFKYPKNYKSLKLNGFDEVTNTTPENLLSSVISASNLDWYNFNNEGKKEKTNQDFEAIKKTDSKDYFLELLYKVHFQANGSEYAIVKYYLHDKNKELLGYADAMKKMDNKWVIISETEVSQLMFFMIMIDTKYIDAIFNNKESDNITLNKIIIANRVNNSINLNNVLNELEEKLSSNNTTFKQIMDPYRLFK